MRRREDNWSESQEVVRSTTATAVVIPKSGKLGLNRGTIASVLFALAQTNLGRPLSLCYPIHGDNLSDSQQTTLPLRSQSLSASCSDVLRSQYRGRLATAVKEGEQIKPIDLYILSAKWWIWILHTLRRPKSPKCYNEKR